MLTNTNYGLDCLETEHMLLGSPQIVWKKGIKKKGLQITTPKALSFRCGDD